MKSREIKSKFIKRFLKRHTRLYENYLPAEEMFEEPRLIMKFGRWRKSGCLPVWRKGNTIKMFRDGGPGEMTYEEQPRGLRWEYSWTDSYKKSHPIKTFFFRKPFYHLPIWLSFYKFNRGMIWKTKWDDYRFEFPAQFSLVFFGLSLEFWLKHPEIPGETYDLDDEYWETILYYTDPAEMSGKHMYGPVGDRTIFPECKGDLLETCKMSGTRTRLDSWDKTNKKVKWTEYYAVRPGFLKEPARSEWIKYMNEHPLNEKKQ